MKSFFAVVAALISVGGLVTAEPPTNSIAGIWRLAGAAVRDANYREPTAQQLQKMEKLCHGQFVSEYRFTAIGEVTCKLITYRDEHSVQKAKTANGKFTFEPPDKVTFSAQVQPLGEDPKRQYTLKLRENILLLECKPTNCPTPCVVILTRLDKFSVE